MSSMLPAARRAEGISYWGLSSVLATSVAPTLGFWILRHGLGPAVRDGGRPERGHGLHRLEAARGASASGGSRSRASGGPLVEWRVLFVSVTLFLLLVRLRRGHEFRGAVCRETRRITPTPIFLTTLAVSILVTRPFTGRLGDRIGYARVLLPCLALIAIGLGLLSFSLDARRNRAVGRDLRQPGTARPTRSSRRGFWNGSTVRGGERPSEPSSRRSTRASAPDRLCRACSSSSYGFGLRSDRQRPCLRPRSRTHLATARLSALPAESPGLVSLSSGAPEALGPWLAAWRSAFGDAAER